jgi:hypothetical protein
MKKQKFFQLDFHSFYTAHVSYITVYTGTYIQILSLEKIETLMNIIWEHNYTGFHLKPSQIIKSQKIFVDFFGNVKNNFKNDPNMIFREMSIRQSIDRFLKISNYNLLLK